MTIRLFLKILHAATTNFDPSWTRGRGKEFFGSLSKTMVESAAAFERQRNPESWLFTNSYRSPHPPGGPASDGNYARVTRRQSHYCGTSDIFIGGRRIATRWFRDRRYFIGPGNILSFPTHIREKKKQGEDGRDRSNKSALIELFFRYVASL